jgi:hypothetical protein
MSEERGSGRTERRARETQARFRSEAEEYVRPQLQTGETIVAVLVRALTRPVYPLIFALLLPARPYSVVVTDRRVLFLRLGMSKYEPRVEDVFDRDQIRVVESRPPTRMWGVGLIVFDRAGKPFKLRPGPHSGADELVEALGGPPV